MAWSHALALCSVLFHCATLVQASQSGSSDKSSGSTAAAAKTSPGRAAQSSTTPSAGQSGPGRSSFKTGSGFSQRNSPTNGGRPAAPAAPAAAAASTTTNPLVASFLNQAQPQPSPSDGSPCTTVVAPTTTPCATTSPAQIPAPAAATCYGFTSCASGTALRPWPQTLLCRNSVACDALDRDKCCSPLTTTPVLTVTPTTTPALTSTTTPLPQTCATFTCPGIRIRKPQAFTITCSGSSCAANTCCLPVPTTLTTTPLPQLCSMFSCPNGWALKPTSWTLSCKGAQCSAADSKLCCLPLTTTPTTTPVPQTCAKFVCPNNQVLRPLPFTIICPGRDCGSTWPTSDVGRCCLPATTPLTTKTTTPVATITSTTTPPPKTCASFWCPWNTVPMPIPSIVVCPRGLCNSRSCCSAMTTTRTTTPLATSTLTPLGTVTTTPSLLTCTSFACPANTYVKAMPFNIVCPWRRCNVQRCCSPGAAPPNPCSTAAPAGMFLSTTRKDLPLWGKALIAAGAVGAVSGVIGGALTIPKPWSPSLTNAPRSASALNATLLRDYAAKAFLDKNLGTVDASSARISSVSFAACFLLALAVGSALVASNPAVSRSLRRWRAAAAVARPGADASRGSYRYISVSDTDASASDSEALE